MRIDRLQNRNTEREDFAVPFEKKCGKREGASTDSNNEIRTALAAVKFVLPIDTRQVDIVRIFYLRTVEQIPETAAWKEH
jgi:hypothetical protein